MAACFFPFIPQVHGELASEWRAIVYPFIYALVTPSLIAAADFILCAQRVTLQKFCRQNVPPLGFRWMGICVFLFLFIPITYISIFAQKYTFTLPEKKMNFMFICFLIDTGFRITCSTLSFIGYTAIWCTTKKKKKYDAIIRQALPIAVFQLFTISIQCILESPLVPNLHPHQRMLLDICFSTASSIAVPLCIVIGETKKREMFYKTICCCFCYCEERDPKPKPIRERSSKSERQKVEEEEAIKQRRLEREERNKRNKDDNNFDSLEGSDDSQESVV